MFDINNIVLPTIYSKKVQHAIENDELNQPPLRLAFVREIVSHFECRLPEPTSDEYTAIAKRLCDKHPNLKDPKKSRYWVNEVHTSFYILRELLISL